MNASFKINGATRESNGWIVKAWGNSGFERAGGSRKDWRVGEHKGEEYAKSGTENVTGSLEKSVLR